MIFEVLHPAILRHVPPRARGERVDLVCAAGHFEMAVAPPDAFEPVPDLGQGLARFFLHEGAPWSRLCFPDPDTPVTPGHLAEVLRGRGADGTRIATVGYYRNALRATPLLAWGTPGSRTARDLDAPVWRGDPIDPGLSRSVAHDGRPGAAEAVAAHLRRDWRVSGDAVYRRRVPLATCARGAQSRAWLDAAPRAAHVRFDDELCAGPATYAAMMAYARGVSRASGDGPDIRAWLDAGLPVEPGEEHRAVANAFPGLVRCRIDHALKGGPEPAMAERLAEARARMVGLELRALTGTCGDDGLAEALAAIRDADALWWEACLPNREGGPAPRRDGRIGESIARLYLPTCPGYGAAAADAADLAALAP